MPRPSQHHASSGCFKALLLLLASLVLFPVLVYGYCTLNTPLSTSRDATLVLILVSVAIVTLLLRRW
ncbi:hypothetical protein LVJ82_05965 [Vitreoscilla massiliensis]|uniref:Uncharacterized protein n=1 Tax=Vitreoscilla massiliensis TaxID=1689272 RepID=A0ABY4E438_9NEIS|nr:hypothetical protein [Vitreoscilla massiliensis]UOO90518.1 hypothetical protein LVJ82_05965 [Vitreoscilla massiliensis]